MSSKTKQFISSSSAETQKFAESFAQSLVRRTSNIPARHRQSETLAGGSRHTHALVVALSGELGSGKTTFVQGFFRGLGLRKRATSPTFIIMRKSHIPARHRQGETLTGGAHQTSRFRHVYHVDAYRIKKPNELLHLGFKEILENPENIVLIEWAEKIKNALPKERITVKSLHGKAENRRQFYFSLPPTMITK